jgi:hypothetical protein
MNRSLGTLDWSKLIALKTHPAMQKLIPDLRRSDHGPFWDAGIPILMWTGSSEFRNSNSHQMTDTLDYEFMAGVTPLLIALLKEPV